MSFESLKRNGTDLSQLLQKAQDNGGGGQQQSRTEDTRFWQPARDKAGNGYAIIRFLPGSSEAATPWVRFWDHFFKGPTGQWYVEKSLTSIGQSDPLAEMNSRLWNEDGSEEAKRTVRERKRNLRYIANVLVISDPANSENEGQVKLFKFGKKIFDKIMETMQPQFPDEAPVNPFDLWNGADFTMKVRKVEGYPNYDSSSFKSSSELFAGNDDKKESVYNQQHDLSEWTDAKNYKTYDELKSRLTLVLGESSIPMTRKIMEDLDNQTSFNSYKSSQPQQSQSSPPPTIQTAESVMDEDDTMSYFAKLANDD